MELLSEYVAPWALPYEEIPIHLFWKESFSYDHIEVCIPQEFELKEFYNVKDFKQENSKYLIKKLKTTNYFGFTVASNRIFKDKFISKKVEINFFSDTRNVFSKTFSLNVYRPYLSLIKSPESITLIENQQHPFEVELKLSGFGNIQIKTEISTGGEFVERAEPMFREIVRRMVSTFKAPTDGKNDSRIKIDPIYLEKKTKDYINRIENGIIPTTVDKELLEEFRMWITDKDNREKIVSIMSRHIERLLVDSLFYYFEQHPADNIRMPQGRPVMLIETATREVRIRFQYRDDLQNEYSPLNLTLPVKDLRENKSTPFKVPINIKWNFEILNPPSECK